MIQLFLSNHTYSNSSLAQLKCVHANNVVFAFLSVMFVNLHIF
jgi:hypothetical protein